MNKPSDFNDLQVLNGLQVVTDQLLAAAANDVSASQENPSRAQPAQSALTASVKKAFGRYNQGEMLENFALIYGTDTVWDYTEHMQMRLSYLRHIVGRDAYKAWDEHEDRAIVRGLAFEPSGNVPDNYINLFRGFPLAPGAIGARGCERILDHVFNLSGCREAEFRYLLNWIAYPLQNLGAKMDSSVIMYGAEGPGKSVLWEQVVSKIYGEYAITIGQAQLESQFTGWQSSKMFALCEEVVSRAERSQHKGQLKHLVTGHTLLINEKNLPLREEANHINFVFLSNSTIPLELDMGDRRYLVLYCGDVPQGDYFKQLFQEINNGGVAEFYRYLLQLDLTGFNEHSRPPLNQDKQNLIDASLPSPVLFIQEWKAGHLDIPYCSCTRADLFAEFTRWCERTNEFKKRDRDFVAEARRILMDAKHDLVLGAVDRKSYRLWVTEGDAQYALEKDYIKRLEASCIKFKDAVKARRDPNGDL